MRLLHLLGLVAAASILAATGIAAHQASHRDHTLSSHVVGPAAPMGGDTLGSMARPAPTDVGVPSAAGRTGSRSADDFAARVAAAVDPGWARRTSQAAGIPQPALTAYARASVLAPEGCRLGWPTLAGIGWVESQHGTIDGRQIRDDGHSTQPILGPALDGRGNVAAIRASRESARWHGNTTWDHAVGPMQFIPSTWRTWATDGDADGVKDPNDIDDAALAAARYLCQSGDLAIGEQWSSAIFSYNHSVLYVSQVYDAALAYVERTS